MTIRSRSWSASRETPLECVVNMGLFLKINMHRED